jgi:hypothetical protein
LQITNSKLSYSAPFPHRRGNNEKAPSKLAERQNKHTQQNLPASEIEIQQGDLSPPLYFPTTQNIYSNS